MEGSNLKRLTFLNDITTLFLKFLVFIQLRWTSLKQALPKQLSGYLTELEQYGAAKFAPYVHLAVDFLCELANSADNQVAACVTWLQSKWSSIKAVHVQGGKLKDEAYLSYKSFVVCKYQAAVNTVGTVLKTMTDLDASYAVLLSLLASIAALPVVARILVAVQPLTDYALATGVAVHDTLVASPQYRTALSAASRAAAHVASLPLARAAAARAGPPLAPFLAKAAASKVVRDVRAYWAPRAA